MVLSIYVKTATDTNVRINFLLALLLTIWRFHQYRHTYQCWRWLSGECCHHASHLCKFTRLQLRIRGNVVCVPADVSTTLSNLPRTSSTMETIAVKLKRRSQYQHAFLTANIRPGCVRQVGMHLVQNGELFKKEHITFNTSILESVDAHDVIMQ